MAKGFGTSASDYFKMIFESGMSLDGDATGVTGLDVDTLASASKQNRRLANNCK